MNPNHAPGRSYSVHAPHIAIAGSTLKDVRLDLPTYDTKPKGRAMKFPIDVPERKRDRASAVAAYDAMAAARPLKPPPLPRTVYAPRSSELALARDIREGAYKP